MSSLGLTVVGAAGRMGQSLIQTIHTVEGVHLSGAVEQPGSPALGKDAGQVAGMEPLNISITDDPLSAFVKSEGVLDFTSPQASVGFADICAQARIVHVIGTTGLGPAEEERLGAAARHAVIVKSGNMSLGVNLLAELVKQAAQALRDDFDIEVLEMHHRHKVDAPSGTAYLLGDAAAQGRDVDLADASVRTRDGHTGPRAPGTIGFATMRGGSVVGEHSVVFAGEGERIELCHRADSREIFARGAVRAAQWAHGRKPGLYSMKDVLGL
ncbi:MAG: 4-hydroxy-tetrahydrodipicolinate reductase [Pseudomonadota bacterium]